MTRLTKPVAREVATVYRGRPIIVELHAAYLTLREKGRRRTVTLDYSTALETAYKLLYREAQREKSKRRRP